VKDNSPTLRQRELGKRLRELRKPHGLAVEYVAQNPECSVTKISRLETRACGPSLPNVLDLCLHYCVNKPIRTKLMALAREAQRQGWWTTYEHTYLGPVLGFRHDVVVSRSFSMYFVPVLLQTEEYTWEILEYIEPNMNADVYRRWVKAVMCNGQLHAPGNRQDYRIARE